MARIQSKDYGGIKMGKLYNLLFGYKTGHEYWIPIKDVIISYDFQLTCPSPIKFRNKEKEFLQDGVLGKIIINSDFELIDGYCSYLICKKYEMDKIPVYFVD